MLLPLLLLGTPKLLSSARLLPLWLLLQGLCLGQLLLLQLLLWWLWCLQGSMCLLQHAHDG
jgi:hypothetical protein